MPPYWHEAFFLFWPQPAPWISLTTSLTWIVKKTNEKLKMVKLAWSLLLAALIHLFLRYFMIKDLIIAPNRSN